MNVDNDDENDPYAEVRANYSSRYTIAVLETIVLFLVFFSMASIAFGKIAEFGFAGHMTHFTNWAWTIQTLFYGLSLAVPLVQYGIVAVESKLGRFTCAILVIFFLPILGITAVVAVVVFVLLGTKSQFLADLLVRLPPTIVMLGNDVFHMIPVIYIVIFFLAFFKLIVFSYNQVLVNARVFDNPARLITFIIWQAYWGTAGTVIIYSLMFDPHEVYKTDVWTGAGLVVGLVTLTFSNLVPLMLILAPLQVGTAVPYSVAWLVHNDYNPKYNPDRRWLREMTNTQREAWKTG